MNKSNYKIEEKDILNFLKFAYFGDLTNPIEAASNRAYLDMCRTLRVKEVSNGIKSELIEYVNDIFKYEISKLISGNIKNQNEFDKWHDGICNKIIEEYYEYKESKIQLTYGQAQKWLNMTIKYLYMLKVYSFDCVFEYLHIPIDNCILNVANEKLGINKPKTAWSKWDEKQYHNYQNEIKSKIKIAPLCWEFENWLNEAQKEAQKVKK